MKKIAAFALCVVSAGVSWYVTSVRASIEKDEMIADHDNVFEALKKRHELDVKQVLEDAGVQNTKDLSNTIKNHHIEMSRQADDLMMKYENKVLKNRKAHEEEIARIKSEQSDLVKAAYNAAKSDANTESDKLVKNLREQHTKELDELQKSYENRLQLAADEVKKLKDQHAEDLNKAIKNAYDGGYDKGTETAEKDRRALIEEHQADLKRIAIQNQNEINAAKTEAYEKGYQKAHTDAGMNPHPTAPQT